MSIPINIPIQPLYRRCPRWDSLPFPEDEGPYMGYTEIFEGGHTYRAVSSGSGRFVAVGSQCQLPFLSFAVEKDRESATATIKFRSRNLKQVICQVLGYKIIPPLQLTLSIGQVLQHYDSLRAELDSLVDRDAYSDTSKEMRLLVDDILLERSLYDGFNMGRLRQQGIITSALLRDIHQRNMDIGVNDLEECLRLGDTSEEEENEYLDAQNAQIEKLAQMGDLDLLSGFCEPLLRSNDIRVVYNSGLLSQTLDKGFLDIYVYILDLVDRTRSMERDIPNPVYTDITYHPLCVAIRLGHYPAVRALILNKVDFFEGYIEDAPSGSDRVFTPLLAAILWEQADIIRLLIWEGPLYNDNSKLVQANNFAVEMGFTHLLEALADLPKTSAHEAMSARYPVPKAPQFLSTGRSSPYQTPILPSPGGNSSVSGISSALCDTWKGQRTQTDSEHFMPCLTNPGTPSGTINSPKVPELYISPQDLSTYQMFSPALSPQFGPPSLPSAQAWSFQHTCRTVQESLEKPFLLDYTRSYKRRSHLGHSSMLRLQQNCRKIDEFCDQHGDVGDYGIIRDQCTNPTSVSKLGLNYLRNILRNHAPSGLVSVLQALLVADALIGQLPDSRERDTEFTEDLYRWKDVALEREMHKDLFDELVCAVWDTDYLTPNIVPVSQEDLLRFDELARDLVSVTHIKPPEPKPIGTRIRAMQRKMKGYYKNRQDVEIAALPGPEPVSGRENSPLDTQVVDPKVVVLLQSVALNVLFATSSAIQDVEDSGSLQHLFVAPASINRSTAIVEDYLSFDGKSYASCDSGIGMDNSLESPMSPWKLAMKDTHTASEFPHQPMASLNSPEHLDPVHLNLGDRSLVLPQQATGPPFDDILIPSMEDTTGTLFSETQLSAMPPQMTQCKDIHATSAGLSGEPPHSQAGCSLKMTGIRCESCGKVLSNTSNLGKHMRTACPGLPTKRHPCRYSDLGCSSESTTKWNRDSHEKKWCRFNPNRERKKMRIKAT